MKIASLRGFLEEKRLHKELQAIREEQLKTASFDFLPFFFAFLKEASINAAVQTAGAVVKGGVKAPKLVTNVMKGAKPTAKQVAEIVPDVADAAKAGVGAAPGGGNMRVMGTSGKSRRKFLRKQMVAQQTGVQGAGTAGARNINVGIREGVENVQKTGLRPVVAAPAAPRAGSPMAAHVDAVGSQNIPVLPGRAAGPAAAAPASGSNTAQRLTELAQQRGLDPSVVLEAQQTGGLSAAMAKLRAARPTPTTGAAEPAKELISNSTLGKAIAGTAAVGGTGTLAYGGYKGMQRGRQENAMLQQRGFDYGMQ
jgi:hypothetical protein